MNSFFNSDIVKLMGRDTEGLIFFLFFLFLFFLFFFFLFVVWSALIAGGLVVVT